MTSFRSADSYWRFAQSVRAERRYIHTKGARAFLRAVVESAKRRVDTAPGGSYLWRAQRGAATINVPISGTDETVEEDYPFGVDRMRPIPSRAREGRANPKGIPHLYLATKRDTAVAEVRPWKAGVVSVGQFQIARDLRLVNTTIDSRRTFYPGAQPDPAKRETAVWGDIDAAFAAPTTLSDDASEYVPTQILAEVFKDHSFDGIAYHSAYGPGHNVVLFDLAAARQVNCRLVRVKEINFVLEQDDQHFYLVKKTAPTP